MGDSRQQEGRRRSVFFATFFGGILKTSDALNRRLNFYILSNLLERHLLRAATSLDRQKYLLRAVTFTIEKNLWGTTPL